MSCSCGHVVGGARGRKEESGKCGDSTSNNCSVVVGGRCARFSWRSSGGVGVAVND